MTDTLVSAFEPFGGASLNASERVLGLLMQRYGWSERVQSVLLPVTRGLAEGRLLDTLHERDAAQQETRLIVALGEAGQEPVVRLEKVAVNFDHFRIPDNGGNTPRYETIVAGGPAAYFARVPVEETLTLLEGKTPLSVQLSLSAGAFVCNHLFYTVSHALHEKGRSVGFVFVHLPAWRPETAQATLEDIGETVGLLIEHLQRIIPQARGRMFP